MGLTIDTIRSASNEEWDAVWKGCEYATYFHSREWADIWRVYTKGAIVATPQLITFTDGRKCLLPLSSRKLLFGLLAERLSSPEGTFGGWISEDELSSEHAKLMADHMTSRFRALTWRLNPYDPNMPFVSAGYLRNDETYSLDLTDGFDAILRKWTKGHSSAARKARKSGITTRKARDRHDWIAYYKAYEDSLARWGDKASSRYDWRLFEDMFRRRSQNVALWLALHERTVVAGALCFCSKNHVVYWHGAALADHFKFRPMNLLLHDVIKEACLEGHYWFDFNPSGGHQGVEAFKKSFGANPMPCPTVTILPSFAKTIMTVQGRAKGALRKVRKMFS